MTEIAPDFDAFLRKWTAGRIGPLGDRTDPSDREYMIKQRAAELTTLAREVPFPVPCITLRNRMVESLATCASCTRSPSRVSSK